MNTTADAYDLIGGNNLMVAIPKDDSAIFGRSHAASRIDLYDSPASELQPERFARLLEGPDLVNHRFHLAALRLEALECEAENVGAAVVNQ
jgi:hypothetical protein